jgi:hypothetical protein
MDLAKKIVAAVWPLLYQVLSKQAEKTETEWDDRVLDSISFFIMHWIESNDDE